MSGEPAAPCTYSASRARPDEALWGGVDLILRCRWQAGRELAECISVLTEVARAEQEPTRQCARGLQIVRCAQDSDPEPLGTGLCPHDGEQLQ